MGRLEQQRPGAAGDPRQAPEGFDGLIGAGIDGVGVGRINHRPACPQFAGESFEFRGVAAGKKYPASARDGRPCQRRPDPTGPTEDENPLHH